MKWTISPMLMTAVATYGTHAATVLHHRQGRVSGARGIELVGSLIEGEPAEPQRLVHGNADGPPRAGRLQDHVAFERPGRVGARVELGAEVLQTDERRQLVAHDSPPARHDQRQECAVQSASMGRADLAGGPGRARAPGLIRHRMRAGGTRRRAAALRAARLALGPYHCTPTAAGFIEAWPRADDSVCGPRKQSEPAQGSSPHAGPFGPRGASGATCWRGTAG